MVGVAVGLQLFFLPCACASSSSSSCCCCCGCCGCGVSARIVLQRLVELSFFGVDSLGNSGSFGRWPYQDHFWQEHIRSQSRVFLLLRRNMFVEVDAYSFLFVSSMNSCSPSAEWDVIKPCNLGSQICNSLHFYYINLLRNKS